MRKTPFESELLKKEKLKVARFWNEVNYLTAKQVQKDLTVLERETYLIKMKEPIKELKEIHERYCVAYIKVIGKKLLRCTEKFLNRLRK